MNVRHFLFQLQKSLFLRPEKETELSFHMGIVQEYFDITYVNINTFPWYKSSSKKGESNRSGKASPVVAGDGLFAGLRSVGLNVRKLGLWGSLWKLYPWKVGLGRCWWTTKFGIGWGNGISIALLCAVESSSSTSTKFVVRKLGFTKTANGLTVEIIRACCFTFLTFLRRRTGGTIPVTVTICLSSSHTTSNTPANQTTWDRLNIFLPQGRHAWELH